MLGGAVIIVEAELLAPELELAQEGLDEKRLPIAMQSKRAQ